MTSALMRGPSYLIALAAASKGALALGRYIRAKGYDTELAGSYSKVNPTSLFLEDEVVRSSPTCASACVLAFAGGTKRTVHSGARIGIHQFYSSSGQIGDSATQVTVVVLATYLDSMGVDRAVLDMASLVPPDRMQWLTRAEVQSLLLDNSEPLLSPWHLSPTAEGRAVLDVSQDASPDRRVTIRLEPSGTMVLATVNLLLRRSIPVERMAAFPVGQLPEVSLCGGDGCLRGQSTLPWVSTEDPGGRVLQGVMTFTRNDLRQLAESSNLSIRDEFPNAFDDVGLSTRLSTDGFGSGIALLLSLGQGDTRLVDTPPPSDTGGDSSGGASWFFIALFLVGLAQASGLIRLLRRMLGK